MPSRLCSKPRCSYSDARCRNISGQSATLLPVSSSPSRSFGSLHTYSSLSQQYSHTIVPTKPHYPSSSGLPPDTWCTVNPPSLAGRGLLRHCPRPSTPILGEPGASAQAFSPRSSHSPSTQLGSEILPQTHAWVVVFPGGESSGADLRNLLQAISDPFEFTPDPPLHDKQPSPGVDYDPMMAAVALIGFASSDLWQIHLQQLNFTSCGNFVSTDEGRKAALKCMTDTVVDAWSGFFCTSSKVASAVKCLEELRCPNTAQVVKEWATAHHWRCACYHRYLCIRGCDLKMMWALENFRLASENSYRIFGGNPWQPLL